MIPASSLLLGESGTRPGLPRPPAPDASYSQFAIPSPQRTVAKGRFGVGSGRTARTTCRSPSALFAGTVSRGVAGICNSFGSIPFKHRQEPFGRFLHRLVFPVPSLPAAHENNHEREALKCQSIILKR